MRLLAITIIASLLAACAPKSEAPRPEAPAPEASEDGTLTGEVFIVTQGGQNIKLGLVPVRLIPESVAKEFLAMKETDAPGLAETLKPEIDEMQMKEKGAQRRWEAAFKRYETASLMQAQDLVQNFNAAMAEAFGNTPAPPPSAPRVTDRDIAKLEAAMNAIEAEQKQYEKALKKLSAEADGTLPKPSFFYVKDLPPGIAEAKTNADGVFSATIPRKEKFMLAATGSRKVLDENETYYWLIWVSLDGAAQKHIMLANDNLTTSGSPESVIYALR